MTYKLHWYIVLWHLNVAVCICHTINVGSTFVFCDAEKTNELLGRLAVRRRLTIGEEWSKDVHVGPQSELGFSYHVVCDENYHGENCSTFCRPRDDTFGHFTCDAAGVRVCVPGWRGDYCTERKQPRPFFCIFFYSGLVLTKLKATIKVKHVFYKQYSCVMAVLRGKYACTKRL